MANKTVYPFGPGGRLPSGVAVVDDTKTGGADKALSAEQGKILGTKLDGAFAEVTQDGVFFVDANLRVGAKITSNGLFANNRYTEVGHRYPRYRYLWPCDCFFRIGTILCFILTGMDNPAGCVLEYSLRRRICFYNE